VKVAVLDTGIDLNHPDLSSKVIEGVSAVSLVSGITVQDVNGHGTHCAGTICGPRESTSGVRYGVAPDIELLVGKVFNNRPRPSATDDDILEGITWADENGARIISMSLGSERDVGEAFAPLYEHLARQLLDRQQNSVLIVAAAGNESERPIFTAPVGNPAACPAIMAVAAIDRRGRIAPFSCRQMDNIGVVDVSAPGVGVFSSIAGGGFELLDGTSMATPHVAGMAALYLEREPNFTAQQLFDQLKLRARRLGDPADFGDGLIRL
jgi:subtilisin family serine protease